MSLGAGGGVHAWSPPSDMASSHHDYCLDPRHQQYPVPLHSTTSAMPSRRSFVSSIAGAVSSSVLLVTANEDGGAGPAAVRMIAPAFGSETVGVTNDVAVDILPPSSDAKKLFNEGRALESQGNLAAAQRLYSKVTQIAPRFVYGWSNLGNAQTGLGDLTAAEQSYNTSIDLCNSANLRADQQSPDQSPQQRRCNDLYILLLNRGSLRLNNGAPPALALQDLQQANSLRARPDAIVLQNLARAEEINGLYEQSDRDYSLAISMTANEVSPFWLRSAMVKLQLGQVQDGYDLLKRVEVRFPEAPEVRAASAVFLVRQRGDMTAGQQKFLEIPDRARRLYSDDAYLTQTVSWPPAMRDTLRQITVAVGDRR